MPFKNILSSISPISEFKIPCSTISFLDNGIKVHSLQDNEASIVKIDFIFEAGTWYQECLLQSLLANSLLLSGTSSFSEKEISAAKNHKEEYAIEEYSSNEATDSARGAIVGWVYVVSSTHRSSPPPRWSQMWLS